VIVPWPPGQATDIAARIVAQKLQDSLGQPFIIENRPGAAGAIGTDIAAKAAPDGYTLLASSTGPITILPAVQKTSFDPISDFAHISLLAQLAYALVTHPSFPAANAKEFVALVRANPDKYAFSSSGAGASAHLITEYFNMTAQLKARHVPYKGTVPALTDIMNGEIAYTIETVPATVGYVKNGRLKALGVSYARGSSGMPDVPSLAQAAELAGFDIGGWIGYAAPRGTPREIVQRLSSEIQKIVQLADVRERYLSLGLEAAATSPDDTVTFMRNELARYGDVARKANIRVD
jgi:tripartite-type tricarboxylate transporter receptor subunit TctC